jgi:hypothetical protein
LGCGGETSLESSPTQCVTHGFERRPGIVARLAQVRENDIVQTGVNTLAGGLCRDAIAQVTELSTDSRLN